jgi:hypothetical protein
MAGPRRAEATPFFERLRAGHDDIYVEAGLLSAFALDATADKSRTLAMTKAYAHLFPNTGASGWPTFQSKKS